MSEAKYKVGDEVETVGGDVNLRATIVEVRTLYKLRFKDATHSCPLWNEDELRPYVRPLAVGDRVRHTFTGASGTIGAIRDGKAAVWNGRGWDDWFVDNCERIPEEAGK